MNSTETQLPYRFRYSRFQTLEREILHISQEFPKLVSFNPAAYQLSPVTFACRLRDSMSSLFKNKWWQSTNPDRQAHFDKIYQFITTSEINPTRVDVGSRESLKKPVDLKPISVFTPETTTPSTVVAEEIIHCSTLAELVLLARLASLRLLSKELKVSGFTPTDIIQLQQDFDCSIEPIPGQPTIYTLL